MPPHQGTRSHRPPMQQGQSPMSHPLSMPPDQGTDSDRNLMQLSTSTMSYPPSMLPNQITISDLFPTQQIQSNISHPSSMLPNQITMSDLPPVQQGQLPISYPPSMAPAQGSLSYPVPILRGPSDQMAPFQPPPVPAQATTSYPPQMQQHQVAISPMSQMQPMPFTTLSAYSQTAHQLDEGAQVLGLRIPADGSPIEQVILKIVVDGGFTLGLPDHKPFLGDYWPERDPTSRLMVRTLSIKSILLKQALMPRFHLAPNNSRTFLSPTRTRHLLPLLPHRCHEHPPQLPHGPPLLWRRIPFKNRHATMPASHFA